MSPALSTLFSLCSNISSLFPPWEWIRLSNLGPKWRVDGFERCQWGSLGPLTGREEDKGFLLEEVPHRYCHPTPRKTPSFLPHTHLFIPPSPTGTNHLAATLMGLVLALCLPPSLPSSLVFFLFFHKSILELVSSGALPLEKHKWFISMTSFGEGKRWINEE